MRTAEVIRLTRTGGVDRAAIRPAPDGSGGYVIRVWPRAATLDGGRTLRHEDGAPLRFNSTARANAMAVRCGLSACNVT